MKGPSRKGQSMKGPTHEGAIPKGHVPSASLGLVYKQWSLSIKVNPTIPFNSTLNTYMGI